MQQKLGSLKIQIMVDGNGMMHEILKLEQFIFYPKALFIAIIRVTTLSDAANGGPGS